MEFTILKCLTTTMIVGNKIYSAVVGKNWLFAKHINHTASTSAKYACSDSIILFITLLCYIASIFRCVDPFSKVTYHVADFADDE